MQNMQPHYYLAYQPPEDATKKIQIEKELSSLECVKLHYSFWRVPRKEIKKALEITRGSRPLVFKRTRELLRPQINFDREIYDLGSVAIIAYRLPKEQIGKRAAVVRTLRKTPRIRIGQSLYLIPYLKASKLESYKGNVMLQDQLFAFLKKEGVDAHRLTYLKIIYPNSHKALVKLMIDHEILACQKLASASKRLMSKINRAELQELPKFQKLLSAYNVKYRAIKGVVFFLYNIMNIDLRFYLKKAYNSLILCKKMYHVKLVRLMV